MRENLPTIIGALLLMGVILFLDAQGFFVEDVPLSLVIGFAVALYIFISVLTRHKR